MPLLCPIDQTENPDGSLVCSECKGKLTRVRPGERSPDRKLVVLSRLREDPVSLTFLAEDPTTGRRCILREYSPSNPSNPQLKKMFIDTSKSLKTAVASMRISYPFTYEDRWYTVADSIDGTPLSAEVERSGAMDTETAKRRFSAILAALMELHGASHYHGNLSSDRVMLQGDGGVRLVDSIFLGQILRDGGPPPLTSMVEKDLRDAGLLALGMVDDQSDSGDLTERIASVQDVAFGATLDYVFSTGKKRPTSAAQVEQLMILLDQAAGSTSAATMDADDDNRRPPQMQKTDTEDQLL